ncbi:MAG: response regulator, partial [Gemmatimonadetes bacterium]|nr:response regulator [Gemmatimonadota bacterium]
TASKVETTSDDQGSRRLEGLLVELRRLVGDQRDEGRRVFEWMAVSAGLGPSRWTTDAAEAAQAWRVVAEVAGLSDAELAEAIADRFDLEPAAMSKASRAARRLVPEAFMAAQKVVPLKEDSRTITVATVEPVSLPNELELERLTGRRPVFAVAPPRALDAVLDAMAKEVPRPPSEDANPPEAEGPTSDSGDGPPDGRGAPTGGGSSASPPQSDQPVGVLIVDDEPSARLLVRALLEKRGFDTIEAADGLEALEVMREHDHIGLAVVDLNMPRMDGLELIWELRDARAWAQLPVIVVTGERDEILETQIMEEGADDYIRKPVDPRLFLARVEATLRRAGHGIPA